MPNSGGTNRDALESWHRQTGQEPPGLRPPCQPPDEVLYLWGWFWEMSQGRPITQAGALCIPPSEILAWMQINQVRLEPWEVKTIQELDRLYLRVLAED